MKIMKMFFFLIGILTLLSSLNFVYAATYDINIPSGAASPDAPFFWQNEKTGQASGDIEISIGDTIIWKNGDTSQHTITSGTVKDGPDGIFGGPDFLVPGGSYKFTFHEKGRFPYYCLIHPWMVGSVTVTDGYKIIPDVGKNVGDGLTYFQVDYQYSGIISKATVNEDQNSITFDITNDKKSLDHKLMLMIPPELIQGPYTVFVDGTRNLEFDLTEDKVNILEIGLPDDVKQITIVGTKVVPEFGPFAVIVLGIILTGSILFQRSKIPGLK